MRCINLKNKWIILCILITPVLAYLVLAVLALRSYVLLEGDLDSWRDLPHSQGVFERLPLDQVRVQGWHGYRQDMYYLTGRVDEATLEAFAEAAGFWFWRPPEPGPVDSMFAAFPMPVEKGLLSNLEKPGMIEVRGSKPGIYFVMAHDPITQTYLAYLVAFKEREYNLWRRKKEREWKQWK